jgi:hypothetical protein
MKKPGGTANISGAAGLNPCDFTQIEERTKRGVAESAEEDAEGRRSVPRFRDGVRWESRFLRREHGGRRSSSS